MSSFAPKLNSREQHTSTPRSALSTSAPIGRTTDSAEQEASQVASRMMSTQPSQESSVVRKDLSRLDRVSESLVSQELFPSPGRELDEATKSTMESCFHFDFGRIRIHDDDAAERTAAELSARAFTQGQHISFGKSEYTPHTSAGQRLLAHELAHVIQQERSPSPVVRRDPALKGQELFGDRDASRIDKVIAASPVAKYIPAKELKTISGNVDLQSPSVFEKQYKDYGHSQEDANEVPGFVNRAVKLPIKLRLPGRNDKKQIVTPANVEDAVHETIHLNSKTRFQETFGHACNEGMTEYFTELVMGEPGHAYRDQVKFAAGFIAAVGSDGEKRVAEAYFKGTTTLYDEVSMALKQGRKGQDQLDWLAKIRSKKPADWDEANLLVKNAMKASQPARSIPPAPVPGATGSGSAAPAKP